MVFLYVPTSISVMWPDVTFLPCQCHDQCTLNGMLLTRSPGLPTSPTPPAGPGMPWRETQPINQSTNQSINQLINQHIIRQIYNCMLNGSFLKCNAIYRDITVQNQNNQMFFICISVKMPILHVWVFVYKPGIRWYQRDPVLLSHQCYPAMEKENSFIIAECDSQSFFAPTVSIVETRLCFLLC